MMSNADLKKMEAFREKFAKDFGDSLHDGNAIKTPDAISTGSIELDDATCIGGWPEGRMVEIYAQDDVGKTTLALIGISEAQRKYPDRIVAYIDVENKLDKEWAVAHGVDLSKLWIYVPETAEETADAVARFLSENWVSMLVVDSIGAMIGKVEMEKNAEDSTVAIVARIVTRMVRAANSQARHGHPVILLINQIRANISSTGYGSPVTRPGGNALKFQSTMRVKLGYTAKPPYKVKMDGDDIEVAREIGATVERNKCGPKGRTAMINLVAIETEKYGPVGIDKTIEVVNVAIKKGIITGSSWFKLPSGEQFHGRDAVYDHFYENPELIEEYRQKIIDFNAPQVTNDLGETDEVIAVQEPKVPRSKGQFQKGKVNAD